MPSVNSFKKDGCITVSFSALNEDEYKLVINAIKRQVDYYRGRVIDSKNVMSIECLNACKHHLKVYNDLYNKIIRDREEIFNLD